MARGRFSLFGHPLHPPFTHFPVALWSFSSLLDVVAFFGGGNFWWQMSFWCIIAGLCLSLLTYATGFIEYVSLPEKKNVMRTANWHLLLMSLAGTAYLGTLLIRGDAIPAAGREIPAICFSLAGLICLMTGGWLGGILIYRHGIATEQGKTGSQVE